MAVSNTSMERYIDLIDDLASYGNILDETLDSLLKFLPSIYRSEQQDKYSEPMFWIGLYIALASFYCVVAMMADLLHGFRNRMLWFPCKYFTINAATLTVIAVAMKLPVDLTGSMPGDVDQATKLGSVAFMCIMMANFLPSLATMDNNALLSNIIGLVISVITLVINVIIQIQTGVVSFHEDAQMLMIFAPDVHFEDVHKHRNRIIASIYVSILLALVVIHVCSSLAILKSKKIIESKYKDRHSTASKLDHDQKPEERSFESLHEHVSKYWIMAETGNPQFITTCYATISAGGVLCVVTAILHIITVAWCIKPMLKKDYESDYKLSMVVIFIIQSIGIVLGTIAPIARCFAPLSFEMSIKNVFKKVFEAESYWTHELFIWKRSSIPFPFRSRKCKKVIEKFKALILSFCIEFQETVVVACKIIALVPYLSYWWLKTEKHGQNKGFDKYVLQLDDEVELGEGTLEGLLKSLDLLIQKGEKQKPKNLMKLLNDSNGFEGVEKYDDDYVRTILSNEYQDCWSLALVTLTTIAVSLPKIPKRDVKSFLKGVSEGIEYVKLVEKTLNANDHYEHIQKAARTLWREVEVDKKWLGTKLKDIGTKLKDTGSRKEPTASDIVQWFMSKAKNVATKASDKDFGCRNNDNTICAYSMYRITKTIMPSCDANDDDKVSQDKLFKELSSKISDILVACLTNLPQVIKTKCHTSTIEKREANVRVAVRLLGETKEILNKLQDQELPHLNASELALIDKWRAYLKSPSP